MVFLGVLSACKITFHSIFGRIVHRPAFLLHCTSRYLYPRQLDALDTFGLYGRLVHGVSTHPSSLGELWKDVIGEDSAWIISCASSTFCFGAALSYSILLGDTFSALAQTIGLSGFSASRRLWILLLSGTILFPLCNMKSLLALAPISITGVFGALFNTVVLGWRCPIINPSSPYNVGGRYFESLSLQQLPRFDTISRGFASPYSLILGGMAAFAYLAHVSAPSFYHAIQGENSGKKGEGSDGTALDAYFKVTLRGFSSVILINCLAMTFGFLTFGGNSSGIIINNFSTIDPMASCCRLLMGVCVLGGYRKFTNGFLLQYQ
jgi:amino acid permease